MESVDEDHRDDPRNNTKWLEFSVFFVLASCRFVDRFGFSAAVSETNVLFRNARLAFGTFCG